MIRLYHGAILRDPEWVAARAVHVAGVLDPEMEIKYEALSGQRGYPSSIRWCTSTPWCEAG